MLKHAVRGTRDNSGVRRTDRTHRAKTCNGEYDLESMLAQVEPVNCHPEHDTDIPNSKTDKTGAIGNVSSASGSAIGMYIKTLHTDDENTIFKAVFKSGKAALCFYR